MFESFRDWDLKDTGSYDELGAGAPAVQSKGTTRESLIEGAKQKHTEREGLYDLRIRCRGVGQSVHEGRCMIPLPVWLPGPMFLLGGGFCPGSRWDGSLFMGVSVVRPPSPKIRKAGNMHPTGMLSCWECKQM